MSKKTTVTRQVISNLRPVNSCFDIGFRPAPAGDARGRFGKESLPRKWRGCESDPL